MFYIEKSGCIYLRQGSLVARDISGCTPGLILMSNMIRVPRFV